MIARFEGGFRDGEWCEFPVDDVKFGDQAWCSVAGQWCEKYFFDGTSFRFISAFREEAENDAVDLCPRIEDYAEFLDSIPEEKRVLFGRLLREYASTPAKYWVSRYLHETERTGFEPADLGGEG